MHAKGVIYFLKFGIINVSIPTILLRNYLYYIIYIKDILRLTSYNIVMPLSSNTNVQSIIQRSTAITFSSSIFLAVSIFFFYPFEVSYNDLPLICNTNILFPPSTHLDMQKYLGRDAFIVYNSE